MHIYFFIDGSDFSEVHDNIVNDLSSWLTESRSSATLINEAAPDDDNHWLLGLCIDTNNKKTLKKPLDFLYTIAKIYKQEFVIGLFDKEKRREDICYFGDEEGKPDLNEVTNYLE